MTNRGLAAAVCLTLAALCAAEPSPGRADERDVTTVWDVEELGQTGQVAVFNPDANGSTLGMPCASADLDGDGYDDAVLAPFLAPAGPANERPRAGELRIVFGRERALTGAVLEAEVVVWGARPGDFLGAEVDAADVTGDGLADILGCAQNADGFGTAATRPGAGMLYVVHGRAEWPATIDLAAEPAGVTAILGATPDERCGFWATGGDVTGDGVKDILVGADLARGPDGLGTSRGKLYIIPGGPDLPARIDLADAEQSAALGVVTVYGVDDCDHLGSCIASADFDGDGIDDVAVSAGVSRAGAFPAGKQGFCSRGQGGGGGPNNDRAEAGEVYLLYGRTSWPAVIELRAPTPDVAIYYGQNAGDHFGEDVRAGDFDGDGRPELAVGALTAAAPSGTPGLPSRSRAGVGYIYWGSELERGERLDLRALPSSNARVARIYGERAQDIGADTIALVDLNGDGLDEMVFASPLYDPPGRTDAGDLKIIYGRTERLPGVVDLADPPVPVYRVIAKDPGDMFAYSFTHGDFDGDGFRDLMPNAMGGDGSGNCCRDAGELYIISGLVFSQEAGNGPPGQTCLSRVEVVPARARYFAGEPGLVLRLRCDGAGGFVDGAVAIVDGVEVATDFVDPTTVLLRLDDVLSVRNTPGTVRVAVRNPGALASAEVVALELVGPVITNVKAKRGGGDLKLNVKGTDFLPGATVEVETAAGAPVPVERVVRKNARKLKVTIEGSAVARGEQLRVRVLNPGPAPSAPATVTVP